MEKVSSLVIPSGSSFKVKIGDSVEYTLTKFNMSAKISETIINADMSIVQINYELGLKRTGIISSTFININAQVFFGNQTNSVTNNLNEGHYYAIPIPNNLTNFNFTNYDQIPNWPYETYTLNNETTITFYDKNYPRYSMYDLKTGWLLSQYLLGTEGEKLYYEQEWNLTKFLQIHIQNNHKQVKAVLNQKNHYQ
jgi:hypothetical protein